MLSLILELPLPNSYKERIIRNWHELGGEEARNVRNRSQVIELAFEWADTLEGYEFWAEVADYLDRERDDLPAFPPSINTF